MRVRRSVRPAVRGGFTLVEVLVAAALAIVIMYVLAAAFAAATDTLSRLKSVGGLADQLRTAGTLLQRDLSDVHLEDAAGDPVRVSRLGPTDDPATPLNEAAAWLSPNRGFFKVVQGTAGTTEGTDDGVTAVRATDHWLHLTVLRSGVGTEDLFTADVRGTPTPTAQLLGDRSVRGRARLFEDSTFVGRAAEVAYFLSPSGAQTGGVDAGPDQLNLQVLRRRVRVLSPSAVTDPNLPSGPGLSLYDPAASRTFNTPESITAPGPTPRRRLFFDTTTTAISPDTPLAGDGSDILLSNVVSMQVEVLTDGNADYGNLPGVNATTSGTFDTAVGTPARPRLRAVRVKLRVYDIKNQVTRQVTVAQAL